MPRLVLLSLFVLVVVPGVAAGRKAAAPPPAAFATLNFDEHASAFTAWGIFAPYSTACDREWRKLYLGVGAYDYLRRDLLVFDVAADGSAQWPPRRYRVHGQPQLLQAYDAVQQVLVDRRRRVLYLAVTSTQPGYAGAVVCYRLDARGEPTGDPLVVPTPHQAGVQWLALHPTLPKLYVAGWWTSGFEVMALDAAGLPTGAGSGVTAGSGPKLWLSVHPNGTKLYLGAYPSVLEVCDLDAAGQVAGEARRRAVPEGPKEYARFAPAGAGLYFTLGGKLAWFPLRDNGEPAERPVVTGMPALAAGAADGGAVAVAKPETFVDTVTGETRPDGVRLLAYQPDARGAPATPWRLNPVFRGQSCKLLGGTALVRGGSAAGFKGNRVKDLQLRVTLSGVQTEGPLPYAWRTGRIDERPYGSVFPIFSPKYQLVYGLGEQTIDALSPDRLAAPVRAPLAAPGSALAIDEGEGILYAARQGGIIEARRLDAAGAPAAEGEAIQTGLTPIVLLRVDPATHRVYALGPCEQAGPLPGAATPLARRVIQLPAYLHVTDAVIARGHLYAISGYSVNFYVWPLAADGAPATAQPQILPDPFPKAEGVRNVLTAMRLDAKRGLIYLGGMREYRKADGWIAVYALDAAGKVSGAPRVFKTGDPAGAVIDLELSRDGKYLYTTRLQDNRIHAMTLDAAGYPAKEVFAAPGATTEKSCLRLLPDGKRLLSVAANTVEVCELDAAGLPRTGYRAVYTAGSETLPLGYLSAGQPSPWIPLDRVLAGKADFVYGAVSLEPAQVTKATFTFEVARTVRGARQPVATVAAHVAAGKAVLLLPGLGVDADRLAFCVQTNATRSLTYLAYAKANGLQPAEKPKQFVVANYLLGLDTDAEAMDRQLQAISLLGTNTAHLLVFTEMPPATIKALTGKYGMTRYGIPNYTSPTGFAYAAQELPAGTVERWAKAAAPFAATLGAQPAQLQLFHLSDEPGWLFPGYFPDLFDPAKRSPAHLEALRAYLRGKGFAPDFFGQASWEAVYPLTTAMAKTLPERRLAFWTGRFFSDQYAEGLAASTAALRRWHSPAVITTTNLNNWTGGWYWPYLKTETYHGGGAPDWFALGRAKSVTHLWTEDWSSDQDGILWSHYADLMRCAAREGGLQFGGYIIGQSTGHFPAGETYKLLSLFGHGGKAVDFYAFGPTPPSPDGWANRAPVYAAMAAGARLLGRAETLLYPGRPRTGTVALLTAKDSIWQTSDEMNRTLLSVKEVTGLHAGLSHASYPVDFVDMTDLEEGALAKYGYAALYLTAPTLSVKAQQQVLAWVQAGGTAALLPGACRADEYNEPAAVLTAAMGARWAPQAPGCTPFPGEIPMKAPQPIAVADPRAGTAADRTIVPTLPLTAAGATVLATFADGTAAVTEMPAGRGRLIAYGYWPGNDYWWSPDRSDWQRLPTGWSAATRAMLTLPARIAGATKHVEVSEPLVEAPLLESPAGAAVTLLNWGGVPLPAVTVTVRGLAGLPEAARAGRLTVASAQRGPLAGYRIDGDRLTVTLPLKDVDVVMITR